MTALINLTNHRSSKWSPKQISEAEKLGEITDMPFPEVDPFGSSEYIDELVEEYFLKIKEYDQPVVLVQGEYLFTYRLVNKLKSAGIKAIAGCSDRRTVEYVDSDGRTTRKSEFEFVGFKEY